MAAKGDRSRNRFACYRYVAASRQRADKCPVDARARARHLSPPDSTCRKKESNAKAKNSKCLLLSRLLRDLDQNAAWRARLHLLAGHEIRQHPVASGLSSGA